MKAQANLLGPVHETFQIMRAANDLVSAVSPEASLIALKRGMEIKA